MLKAAILFVPLHFIIFVLYDCELHNILAQLFKILMIINR